MLSFPMFVASPTQTSLLASSSALSVPSVLRKTRSVTHTAPPADLASNSFTIRTYAKSAHNSFIMNTSKTKDLKLFRMNTYEKNGEGLPTSCQAIRGRVGTLSGWPPSAVSRSGCGAERAMAQARIVDRSRTQHGAQHRQQPIRHAAQRSPMRMPASAQPPVVFLADGVVLRAHARPVIGGVAHPLIAAVAHLHAAVLAALPRQRRDSGIRSQRVVVSFHQGLTSLGQHRGGDNTSGSRQGSQDGHVTMLLFFSLDRFLSCQLLEHRFRARRQCGPLLRQQTQMRQEQQSMLAGGFHRSRHQRKTWRAKLLDNCGGAQPPHAMRTQQFFDARLRQPPTFRRVWSGFQHTPHPRLIRLRTQHQELRIVALQLFAQLTRIAAEVHAQLFVQARKIPQSKNLRVVAPHQTKTVPVGAQSAGQHQRVAAIIFRAGRKIAIAKPIQLFGIQGKHRETAFQQRFHQRSTRHFDGHGHRARRTAVAQLRQPAQQRLQSCRRVQHLTLPERLALRIQNTNLMRLRSPIDAHKKYKTIHVGHKPPFRPAYAANATPVLALTAQTPHWAFGCKPAQRGACPSQALPSAGALWHSLRLAGLLWSTALGSHAERVQGSPLPLAPPLACPSLKRRNARTKTSISTALKHSAEAPPPFPKTSSQN